MQRTKIIVLLVLFITIVAIGKASGNELHQKNGFSITLPDEWVEMPRDIIDLYENKVSKQAPNAKKQHYDYGFQLESSNNWFEYPYILVQIKNTGRIPENQLEKLENYSFKDTINKSKKDMSSLMSDIQAGKMYYDKHEKIIWVRIEMNVVNVGIVSGLCCMVPTEKGFIQVNGYSLRNKFSNYEPFFRSVSMSVSPEPGLVYKPKWSDSLPPVISGIDWGKVAGKAIAGAIIAGIIALIAGLLKKKKNRK